MCAVGDGISDAWSAPCGLWTVESSVVSESFLFRSDIRCYSCSPSPCGHIRANPAHGRWRVDSDFKV